MALGKGVRVIAGMCVDAAFSGPAVECARARGAEPLEAEDLGDERLERVAKREVAAVSGGGGAAAALGSVAEGARDAEGGVALPLVQYPSSSSSSLNSRDTTAPDTPPYRC